MMMKFLSFFLVLAISASQVLSGKQCPGGYADGTQMDIGRYWYECSDGLVKPKGCLADDGRRVDIDGTFDVDNSRMQCVLGTDNFLTVVYKACVLKGGEHDVGSQWDDGVAFFTCVREGSNVRVITLGCVDQGRPMKLDERVVKGDFIFQCKKSTAGTPTMNKVGCVQDGHKFTIGESYEGSKFWYTCTDSGSKIVGCMYESHRLVDGDHFTKGDNMFACKVNDEKTDLVPFACIQNDESGATIERKVGCSWIEGVGTEAFQYTCKSDSSNKANKVQTHCVYRSSKGVLKMEPGCVQTAETFAVGCRQDASSGKLHMETFNNVDNIDNLPGLRKC